jgi:hypothetical protein
VKDAAPPLARGDSTPELRLAPLEVREALRTGVAALTDLARAGAGEAATARPEGDRGGVLGLSGERGEAGVLVGERDGLVFLMPLAAAAGVTGAARGLGFTGVGLRNFSAAPAAGLGGSQSHLATGSQKSARRETQGPGQPMASRPAHVGWARRQSSSASPA